jgi:hypothetical protein
MVSDDHGIGGDGEYCGDGDAQLGCINVYSAPRTLMTRGTCPNAVI